VILGFVEDVFLSLDIFPPYNLGASGMDVFGNATKEDYSWLGLYMSIEGGARLGDKTGDYVTRNL